MYVHARPVHIEVAQPDVIEPEHGAKALEHTLVEGFCCPIESVVVVWVVPLGRGELFGKSVRRGRGCGDYLADAVLLCCLQHVEGAVDQNSQSETWLLGALSD